MSKYALNGDKVPEIIEIHLEEEDGESKMEITFSIEAAFEGLSAAFYMDGSASMNNAGNYGSRGLGLLGRLGRAQRNPVEESMRAIIPYIAGLDTNASCQVAYWATGNGQQIEVIGELDAESGAAASFGGPKRFGNGTFILPAIRDFVAYTQKQATDGIVKAALAVIVTDGQLHDGEDAARYCRESLAMAIESGKFPTTSIVLIGVGPDIDEKQLEEFEESATPQGYSGREIVHATKADSIEQLPELVSHLVSATSPAFAGGASIVDDQGKTLLTYEDIVPAVLEFKIDPSVRTVTIRTSQGELTVGVPTDR